jgi:putative hydrolase of the HAD superfamily
MSPRIPCRAVFLDAGGVIVLPDRRLVADALARIGVAIDAAVVPRAHYRAVRALDRAAAILDRAAAILDRATATATVTATATPTATAPTRHDYAEALIPQLGIVPGRAAAALAAWNELADRRRSGVVLWREPTPGAMDTIHSLQRAGLVVVIVTNSSGHAEENLCDSGFGGVPVIDSTVVGVAKPDPRIFEIALGRAGVPPAETVHVGDSLANDVAGARAAGITPIHLDPLRVCRAGDHRHIRTLAGIWQHVAPPALGKKPGL